MVEIPGAAGWKSLPKWRIFLIWVENPRSACLKSLPKRREIGKRVEIPDNVKGKKIQKEEYKENLMHIIKFFAYKEGVLKKKSSLKLYGDIFHQGLNI